MSGHYQKFQFDKAEDAYKKALAKFETSMALVTDLGPVVEI